MVEVIFPNQSTFLPLRYILDNIVLMQETISWAKTSKQQLILFKLDSAKAYDSVSWDFLFKSMEAMGIGCQFIRLTKLLFVRAEASMCVNEEPSRLFEIKREFDKDVPLFPTFFW
jgi:hypothetical protein